ncbi:rhodanese-like domain-containing protein [Desulfobacula sp.]|uniref:rhodanese-like domain-containing protein n=1 Tax=Desulfobacula sp. TaxID=2593537 RepID=UPI00261680FE|nr:rhodanese-like domain-containing protein [Desulfobacula sp.]
MNEKTISGMTGPLFSGRRYFYRRSICDARLEFSQIDSREKIIEACLLTAIGTLGITCGFSGITHPDRNTVQLVSRGLEAGGLAVIKKKFQALIQRYFPALITTPYAFHAELRIIEAADNSLVQLMDTGIRICIGWRMGKDISGMIGLGPKIISDTYGDDEINFLLNLTDNMIFYLQSLATRRRMQDLKQELNTEIFRSADLSLAMDVARKNLDHTLFRLSGFNDIFNELSALKESTSVVDAFLLVLLGIFGAAGGYIFYVDPAMQTTHMTCRNLDMVEGKGRSPEQIQKGIAQAVEANRVLQINPMQAIILSVQQMDCFKPFLPKTAIGIIFRLDETAMGIVGLDERLIQTPYGEKERTLFLAFIKNFLVFLKNSKSFETIQILHQDQERKNIELEKTIQALSDSSRTIVRLEKAGERIKAAITKAMVTSRKVSVMDMSLILIAGIVLGLVYNFASPGGIKVIPGEWLRPPMVHVEVQQARQLLEIRQALFVDARPAEFFNQRHIAGARNLPLSLFDFVYMMQFNQEDVARPIVVYGRNISRRYDEEIAFRLLERGHEQVVVFPGGIKAWEESGMGVEP